MIVQDDARAARIVQDMTGAAIEGPFAGLVVGDGAGVVLVSDYRDGQCELWAYGKWFVTPRVVREVFRYVFGGLGVRRINVHSRPDNKANLKAMRVLGFRYEGRLREWYADGSDALVFGLLAREQKLVRL